MTRYMLAACMAFTVVAAPANKSSNSIGIAMQLQLKHLSSKSQCGLALLLQTGYIDYDKLEDKALDFRPKMIICGGSAYPREWDYKRLRQIADKVGAYLMSDMAHIR